MSDDTQAILNALGKLPDYADSQAEDVRITRLGGMTNRVYRVEHQRLDGVVVRLAGEGTEQYIDRNVELNNARQAAVAGVAPEVLYAEATMGLMITRLVPGVETMTPDLFSSQTDSVRRAGIALRRLHDSGVPFEFRFELFAMIDDYLRVLEGKTTELPDGYHDIVRQAKPLKAALAKRGTSLSACHCDPLCENFLDDGRQMWIVDWEYSGMNDPWWDLGDLSVEGGFDQDQDIALMQAYCQGEPQPWQHARMIIYKAMCDLLWTLWGLIQHADNNPAEDFWAYATGRFARCRTLMNSDEFERQQQRLG